MHDNRKGAIKRVPRKLSETERAKILEIACNSRFKDSTAHEIVPLLLEDGEYYGSVRTFYRVLKSADMLYNRSNSKDKKKKNKPPEKIATGPNQVWVWDITLLKSDVRGLFYYAYVIKDIYDKSIVGWEIHESESGENAKALFRRLARKNKMSGIHLHSDNGSPMKSITLLEFLNELHVGNSYSRPRVSNDNAFIESFFKTMKYCPSYPKYFKSLDDSRIWMAEFIHWYNNFHLHSALGYITPMQKRKGKDIAIFKKRNKALKEAKNLYPERWGKRKTKQWIPLEIVVLNPDEKAA